MKVCRRASLLLSAIIFHTLIFAQTTERIYLSGEGPSDAVEWDFYCSEGRKSGEWTKIPVPSNWEQHGFGEYDYGHVPPEQKSDETGTYKTTFFAPEAWKEKAVRIVFEGAMTETSVKVNGKPLGVPHLGGYLPFSYSLNSVHAQNNDCLNYGEENVLEVTVAKKPSDESVDLAERKADFWVFGGIYRPVYIEVMPQMFINRLAVDAKADGKLTLDVYPQTYRSIRYNGIPDQLMDAVEVQVISMDGEPVGPVLTKNIKGPVSMARLTGQIDDIIPWSTENPQLYKLRVSLKNAGEVIHETTETFGFRTFEVREDDGLYLNGEKLMIKGVNRNVMHPATARAINPEDAWNDARLIKAMNANLVRSHMPATKYFMEACDQLGLLCIAEFTNWHSPYINTKIARNMVHELVPYYQNHPSVILWANGNEFGYNIETDEIYKTTDIQQRPVIHPDEVFDGIDTRHYRNYPQIIEKSGGQTIFLPTEFLHGLYDGGLGAGLEDYWQLMKETPHFAGGVLWCWADAAVERTDKDGWLDTDGNYSADGIVGPHREKEASYYTIREIWSPVQINMDQLGNSFNGLNSFNGFNGSIPVQNHFNYTSLNQCSFHYSLTQYSKSSDNGLAEKEVFSGTVAGPDIQPGGAGELSIKLPANWKESDVLKLTATGSDGYTIMSWSWPVNTNRIIHSTTSNDPLLSNSTVIQGDLQWVFNKRSGLLEDCLYKGVSVGLKNGPVLYYSAENEPSASVKNWKASFIEKDGGTIIISSKNRKTGDSFEWAFFPGKQAELTYEFTGPDEQVTYCAVGFDLPEEAVQSKQWSGNGPFRIWGNRTKGPQYGLWENEYNDAVPGYRWTYPAFKGVFGDVDWMTLRLKTGTNLSVDPQELLNVGVLKPSNPDHIEESSGWRSSYSARRAVWDYPEEGGLYIFHKAPAVGTKFKRAEDLGPQSEPALVKEIRGTVRFNLK